MGNIIPNAFSCQFCWSAEEKGSASRRHVDVVYVDPQNLLEEKFKVDPETHYMLT